MFYLCEKRVGTDSNGDDCVEYGVMDTDDGVCEFYSMRAIIKFIKTSGIKIKGVSQTGNGKYVFKIIDSNDNDVISGRFASINNYLLDKCKVYQHLKSEGVLSTFGKRFELGRTKTTYIDNDASCYVYHYNIHYACITSTYYRNGVEWEGHSTHYKLEDIISDSNPSEYECVKFLLNNFKKLQEQIEKDLSKYMDKLKVVDFTDDEINNKLAEIHNYLLEKRKIYNKLHSEGLVSIYDKRFEIGRTEAEYLGSDVSRDVYEYVMSSDWVYEVYYRNGRQWGNTPDPHFELKDVISNRKNKTTYKTIVLLLLSNFNKLQEQIESDLSKYIKH